MRLLVVALALVAAGAGPGGGAGADDLGDDPKCARGECLPLRTVPLEEDDPKLARGLSRRAPTARVDVAYRFLQIADPYGGSLPFHLVEVTGFPVSGIFRLGLSLTAGGGSRYTSWMADLGVSAGLQYPARVTPYLDLRFSAGVIGAEIVGRKVVSYTYRPTLEGGLEVFVAGRLHLTAAVGWSHPVYGGVDANAIEQAIQMHQNPSYTIEPFAFDTVTARVGLGF